MGGRPRSCAFRLLLTGEVADHAPDQAQHIRADVQNRDQRQYPFGVARVPRGRTSGRRSVCPKRATRPVPRLQQSVRGVFHRVGIVPQGNRHQVPACNLHDGSPVCRLVFSSRSQPVQESREIPRFPRTSDSRRTARVRDHLGILERSGRNAGGQGRGGLRGH